MILDETNYFFSVDIRQNDGFYPLSEIIDPNQDIFPLDEDELILHIMSKARPLKGHGLIIECNSLVGTCWLLEFFYHS